MEIKVNGEKRQVDGPMTLLGLLEELGVRPQTVVVELNLRVIPRGNMETEMVREGDSLEVIRLVGGG
ncbi:MAG: sulfur carrier protein ThiS [Deltaproteobacteria bacterium]|nr:sulfur carrier protein ThiS [Deltaproteobacteria bacterium]